MTMTRAHSSTTWLMMSKFIAVNLSYKSTKPKSAAAGLIRHYIDQLAELYSVSSNDASNIFLRTDEGKAYLVEYAKTKGVNMEYYEFFEHSEYSNKSPIAYRFRIENNDALTMELLEVDNRND